MLKKINIPESLIDAYSSHLDLEKILVTRLFCVMTVILALATMLLDKWSGPSVVYESNIARIIIIAIQFVIIYITYKPDFAKYCSFFQGLGCVTSAIAICYIIYSSIPTESGYYIFFGFLVLIILGLFSWSHISLKWSCIDTFIIMGIYTFAVYINDHDNIHNFLERYIPSIFIMFGGLALGILGKSINENHIRQNFLYLQSIKQSEKTQEYYANHDALTGLCNRRYSDKLFAEDLAYAKSHNLYNVMMLLDLNYFKSINDKYGHRAGDMLLKTVSNRLKKCLRESDHISRLGGDEFAISILLNSENVKFVDKLRNEIKQAVLQTVKFEGQDLSVGVSIGMAKYPCDADECEALLNIADSRMYEDKKTKKGLTKTKGTVLDSELFKNIDSNTLIV